MSDASQADPLQAVFPLNTPLFPGCKLLLQIFEQRYIAMVSSCLANNSSFVIALLREGQERREVQSAEQTELAASKQFYALGTRARIIDFGQRDNGLLSITLLGEQRARLSQIQQQADGLWLAKSEGLEEYGPSDTPIPAQWREGIEALGKAEIIPATSEELASIDEQTAINYLAMYLPLPNAFKQSLLEQDNLDDRRQHLFNVLQNSNN